MLPEFIKPWGLKLISAGLNAPENPLDRFVEFTKLKQLLAKLEIDCVLDVGANDGQFARNLRAIGYRGRTAAAYLFRWPKIWPTFVFWIIPTRSRDCA